MCDALDYDINLHNHRFAAWAAARAASVQKCRFSVKAGVEILEYLGFHHMNDPDQLPPASEADIDACHAQWREDAIGFAQGSLQTENFTHGIAAKLINVYLKARFVCGGQAYHPRVIRLHPPIDRLLLDELAASNIGLKRKSWSMLRDEGWSNYSSERYMEAVSLLREAIPPGEPLWLIESYWRGYQ